MARNKSTITVATIVNASIEKVWQCWTDPVHISGWAFESSDWKVRDPENDLRVGGKFKITTEAKDGSASVDFSGTYTAVEKPNLIKYDIDDSRHVKIEFSQTPMGVRVVETFDPEDENSEKTQNDSWQATLDNFKKYVER